MSTAGSEPEKDMLAEARSEVIAADQKASTVLTTLGIGFGALLAGLLARQWSPGTLHGGAAVFWWIGAGVALTAVGLCASAVWPRYRANPNGSGPHYWGDISRFDSEAAMIAALDAMPIVAGARVRHQLWTLSQIVRRKYCLVRLSLIAAGLAAVLFLLSVAVAA